MRAPSLLLCASLALSVHGCAKTVTSFSNPDGGGAIDAPVPGDAPGGRDVPSGTPCFANLDCDDGTFCNGMEACVDGRCARAAPINCDDGLACTTDLCDEANRTCRNAPDDARCPSGARCDVMRGCVTSGCTSDAACDDREPCNGAETCRGGTCVRGTPRSCDDGRFCNGVETCRAGFGCVPGTPPRCDADPCGARTCSEAARACVAATPGGDEDGDGFRSMACGGDDCDDRDPAVNPRATERCTGGLDENCDGRRDCEDPACGLDPACGGAAPPNDRCAGAIPIGVGETAAGTTARARNDDTPVPEGFPGCAGGSGGDVVYVLTVRRPTVLTLDVRARGWDPVLYLRRAACATGPQVACNDDRNGLDSQVSFRAEAGTYYVFVDGFGMGSEGEFELAIREGAPPTELCTNRVDDDGDGSVDCDDPDCAGDPGCVCVPQAENDPRTCTDGLDNDCDGTRDCEDTDCRQTAAMGAECCNGRDDNGNGFIDEFACACTSGLQCQGIGVGSPFPSSRCWVNSFGTCGPTCEQLGGNAFCANFVPGTRCNPRTGDCR